MKNFFKKHIGLIVLLILILSFPASLSTQARLNMRVLITGLAIDKTDNEYEITAQIVKPAPDSEGGGSGAKVNFVSEKADSILSAISKISYKTGKIAGFSHINFLILGNDLLSENLSQELDYFVRDNIIKDSILVLMAKDKAKDEIAKTKDLELSVGVGLQNVYLYKEKESDGKMTSLLEFMKNSKSISKTAVLSCLEFGDESTSQASSQTQSQSQSGGAESSGTSENQSFEALSPLYCFVDGKSVGNFETEDEIVGYMLSYNKSKIEDIVIKNFTFGQFSEASIGVKIKNKSNKIKVRFEESLPCVDVFVNINNATITDIKTEDVVCNISKEEFEQIKEQLKTEISSKIAVTFEKSKQMKADIFDAYDLAQKFHYNQTKANFKSLEEFVEKLKLNVIVKVSRLEY